MCASATAPTASRRSSPSARSWRAACCAMSGACSKCRSARSTSSPSWCRRIRPTPVTLKQAIEDEPRLQRGRRGRPARRARCSQIAETLEGLYSNASTHAAGIVIGDRPLDELVPLYRDPKSRHAGDPVQHEMGRAGGPREVRLSRPEDADDTARRRRACSRRRGIEIDLGEDSARRQEDLRDARARRDGRRVPGGKRRHAQGARRDARRPFRGHHRARRALPAGPDGQHPDLLRAQARPGERPTTSIRSSSRC